MTLLGLFLQLTTSLDTAPVQSALITAPSLVLHVTSKRKTMKLHGKSEFNIYATPVVSANGTSVLYNSYATFVDEGSEFTYTLLDGAAYLTTKSVSNVMTVRCLSRSALPFHKILPALNDVTPIASASIGKDLVECASGNLFKMSFLGVHYAICRSGEAGFIAFSSNLDISVEYLDRPVSIPKPQLTDGSISCESIEMTTSMTPTALALITGGEIPSSVIRRLKSFQEILNGILPDEYHLSMQAECEPKSTPRPCILFHGLGNRREKDELQDTPELIPDKLGDIRGHAPFCSSIKYAIINTSDAGWRSDRLQQKYCDHALSMSNTSDEATGTIKDTIIVTHSMGGLVMAGALANGRCKLSPTTSWVSLSPPMAGSMASDYLANACDTKVKIAVKLLEVANECPITPGRMSTFRQGEKHMNLLFDWAYVAAQKAHRHNVTAVICSDSFLGIFSKYQQALILTGTMLPHKSKKNDGLVEFESCLGGLDESKFGRSYMDTFYRAELNHADTAFLSGDGFFRDSQKPLKWFECLPL
ncbi:unnamed protein product [Peronospora destructor]|uniref:GPI inositol-deacylase n=1 Tax=Peronospora destructor TaxID=86335 RepID=A0AAV0VCH4_9STRA|nr:unnamed protein product [Peronospora destructor]